MILELRKGSFTPSGVHLFIISMSEKPVGEINLQGGKNPRSVVPLSQETKEQVETLSTDDTYRYVCLNKRLVGFSLTW